jgi:hypothetical protein
MINIRNTTIQTPTRKAPARRQDDATYPQDTTLDLTPPRMRGFQAIPSEGVLTQLIERALGAFKQGRVWDRGSILNIEV